MSVSEDWSVFLPRAAKEALKGADLGLVGRKPWPAARPLDPTGARGRDAPDRDAGAPGADAGVAAALARAAEGCGRSIRELADLRSRCEAVAEQTGRLRLASEAAVRESTTLNRTADLVAKALRPFECVQLCGAALGLELVGAGGIPRADAMSALGQAAESVLLPDGSPRRLSGAIGDAEAVARVATALIVAGEDLITHVPGAGRAAGGGWAEAGAYAVACRRLVRRASGLLRSAVVDAMDAAATVALEAEEAAGAGGVEAGPGAAAGFPADPSSSPAEGAAAPAAAAAASLLRERTVAAAGAAAYARACRERGVAAAVSRLRFVSGRLSSSPLRTARLIESTSTSWDGATGAVAAVVAATGGHEGGASGGEEDSNSGEEALLASVRQHWAGRERGRWGALQPRLSAAVAGTGDEEDAVRRAWAEAERAAREEESLFREACGAAAGGAGPGDVSSWRPAAAEREVVREQLGAAGAALADAVRPFAAVWGAPGGGAGAADAALDRLCSAAAVLTEEAEARRESPDEAERAAARGARAAASAVLQRIEYVVYSAAIPALAAAGAAAAGEAADAPPPLGGPLYPEALARRYAPQAGGSAEDLLYGSGSADGAAIRARRTLPAVEAACLLLSRLYRVFPRASLRRVGADVVAEAVSLLRAHARSVAAAPPMEAPAGEGGSPRASLPRSVDAALCRVSHAVALRDALAPLGMERGDAGAGGAQGAEAEAEDDDEAELGSAAQAAVSGLWRAVGSLLFASADDGEAAAARSRSARAARVVVDELGAAVVGAVEAAAAVLVGPALPLSVGDGSAPVVALAVAGRPAHDAALAAVEASCGPLAGDLRRRLTLYLPDGPSRQVLWRALADGVAGPLVRWRASLQAAGAVAEDDETRAWAADAAARVRRVLLAVDEEP